MLPLIVETYLNKHALQGWEIESSELNGISTVVVIPAIREYENIRALLNSFLENDSNYFGSTLILFVINNSTLSCELIKEDNRKSILFLNSIIEDKIIENDELINNVIKAGLKIGLVDASSEGKELPQKDAGVGLARKIGMDLALHVFNYNTPGKKILICLDADCIIEKNYLSAIVNDFNKRDLSCAVVNYMHKSEGDSEEIHAIICYEIFLRYYELGLLYACSPYAFPTIGSTIICGYEAYLKTEGMNKRKAAEDFYFLEKLAKNFSVERIKTTTVYPSARRSWRVPFGTGQRINRYLAGVQDEYLLYDPKCFYILKEWLKIFNDESRNSVEELLKTAGEIDEGLLAFLNEQKFESDWQKILKNSKTQAQIQHQKIVWFDGFRTLKLIHFLRDFNYPMINMFNALNQIITGLNIPLPEGLFSPGQFTQDGIPELEIQKKYLDIMRSYLQG